MSETVNGTLAYVNEQRSGKNYFRSGEAEENLIHPLHIADRKRDKVRAMIDWSATEKLNLQFAAESSTDKYGNGPNGNPLGIQKGTGSFFSADANYQVQTDWELNGWVSLDESKADETTYCGGTLPAPVSCDEGTGGTNRKYNSLKETGTSFGVGIKGKVSSRLKIGGNVEQFRSINKYNQIDRLPSHVWFRLRGELSGLIMSQSEGCLNWYHRQLREAAEERYQAEKGGEGGVHGLRKQCSCLSCGRPQVPRCLLFVHHAHQDPTHSVLLNRATKRGSGTGVYKWFLRCEK
jgi:hypothetical protein